MECVVIQDVDPILELRKAVKKNDLRLVKELIASGQRIALSTHDLDELLWQLPEAAVESFLLLDWPQPMDFLSPGRLLSIAAERGDTVRVNQLISEELEASAFASAALLAAQNDHAKLATRLFERSCKAKNGRWDSGKAFPLLYEAWISLLPHINEPLSLLQTQFAIDKRLRTAFMHFAAMTPNCEALDCLLPETRLDENADLLRTLEESMLGDCNGTNVLQRACFYGNVDAVELLLNKGAKPNSKDRRGRSALHYAAESGKQQAMERLLSWGGAELLNMRDNEGMTALHVATAMGQKELAKKLIEKGANPRVKSRSYGAETGFDLLLDSYLPIQREIEDELGTTPGVCSRLSPLTSSFWSPGGSTALHFAVVYGGKETAEALLLLAPDLLHIKDAQGLTPFDWAQACGWGIELGRSHTETPEFSHDCSFTKQNAIAQLEIAKRSQERKEIVAWIYQMGYALKTFHWALAHMLAAYPTQMGFTLDHHAWDHLVWALKPDTPTNLALWGNEKRASAKDQKQVWKNHVQSVLLKLFTNVGDKNNDGDGSKKKSTTSNAITNKSLLQSCLMWAMEQHMVDLAIHLARNRDCDLLEVTQGCKFTETPLQYATAWQKLPYTKWDLRPVLKVMEHREDVLRTMHDDRSLYVDYLNSLLVASVLITGLAFSSWLQPPLGASPFLQLDHNYSMKFFTWFNQIGFFLSMAATIVCMAGAIPIPTGQLAYFKRKIHNATTIATILIISSAVCVSVAFNCALFALIPPTMSQDMRKDLKMVSTIIGSLGCLTLTLLFYRLIQLWDPNIIALTIGYVRSRSKVWLSNRDHHNISI